MTNNWRKRKNWFILLIIINLLSIAVLMPFTANEEEIYLKVRDESEMEKLCNSLVNFLVCVCVFLVISSAYCWGAANHSYEAISNE